MGQSRMAELTERLAETQGLLATLELSGTQDRWGQHRLLRR
jgi:hypothetical protein